MSNTFYEPHHLLYISSALQTHTWTWHKYCTAHTKVLEIHWAWTSPRHIKYTHGSSIELIFVIKTIDVCFIKIITFSWQQRVKVFTFSIAKCQKRFWFDFTLDDDKRRRWTIIMETKTKKINNGKTDEETRKPGPKSLKAASATHIQHMVLSIICAREIKHYTNALGHTHTHTPPGNFEQVFSASVSIYTRTCTQTYCLYIIYR